MFRNAESVSLNKVLGYSHDPFAVLPKQLLSHENFLLDHCMFVPPFMPTTNNTLQISVSSSQIRSKYAVSLTR